MKKTKWMLSLTLVVLCLGIMLPTFAQTTSINGSVKTKQGEALPGVSIVEKGTLNGSVTNIDGNYTINVADAKATLIFTFVGYQAQEVALNGATQKNVILEESVLGLDEVVVVGYGEVRKSDLTGSISTVKVEKLQDSPSNSIDRLLQGRSAGLQVVNSSQDPGAGATVRIRGGSSLRGSNAPLVVVDGFPLGEAGDLKQINPADIESVEILKDASASAIYGSRGANGVIMITTKKAKSGTSYVDIQQQTTISQFSSKLNKWTDPLLMAQLANEEMANAGLQITYNGQTNSNGVYYPSIDEIQSGEWPHNTNWEEVVFRDLPISTNTTVAIRSANDQTSFNLSANYLEQNGVYIEDEYKKFIVNLGVNHKVNDKLKVSSSNIFSRNFRNNNGGLAYWRNPLWPVYNDEGEYYRTTITDFGHPLAQTENVLNKSQGLDYITSYLFDYKITDDLNIKSQVNYKFGMSLSDQYNPKDYTEGGYFNNGAAYINNWMGHDLLSETYLTYKKEFAGIHKITAMGSHSYQYGLQRSSNMGSYDFVNEALLNENMSAGNPEKNTHSNSLSKTEMLSFTGRINYILMDKYLFTATYRADGSSKFGANNKWAQFPSGAISWKAHNEEFIKSMGVFDEFKVRASYGISGNQGISPYQTLSRYGNETYYDNGKWNTAIGPGYVVGTEGADGRYRIWGGIPNNDLKWETTAQYDIGLDMAFFDRRLRMVLDVYQKNTTDLLRERLLSLSSGYNRIWVNDGEKKNRGIELTIDGDIVSTNDFTLSSTFIFSKNKDEIVDLGDAIASGLQVDVNTGMEYEFTGYNFTQFRQSANILAIGQAVNVFYGYQTDGIIQTLAEGIEAGLSGEMAQPGEFKYVDLNGDDVIDVNDRTVIGDPNPDFIASMAIDMSYKNFDLSVFLNCVYGNDVLYQNRIGQANVSPLRWTLDNPTNDYPSLRNGRQYFLSDWFIQDGSFLRIQNLNLAYNFDVSKVKNLSKVRLYVNASNLYTFSKFKGYDPEVGLDGIYWGGYPRLRNWTFGVNVTF
ncbi:MAG: SusC/RagA family TonB-linked outer membrane protein [Prolixibacteraceae bacterium]